MKIHRMISLMIGVSALMNVEAAERPNVLIIMTDDMRYDLMTHMGHPYIQTPNLDRLAVGAAIPENPDGKSLLPFLRGEAGYGPRDRLLMQITAIKPGLYKVLPDGMPERTLLFDLKSDPKPRTDLRKEFPEQVGSMNRQIHDWLNMCHEPLTSQQADYHRIIEKIK